MAEKTNLKIKFKSQKETKLLHIQKADFTWSHICSLVSKNFDLMDKSMISLKYNDSEDD